MVFLVPGTEPADSHIRFSSHMTQAMCFTGHRQKKRLNRKTRNPPKQISCLADLGVNNGNIVSQHILHHEGACCLKRRSHQMGWSMLCSYIYSGEDFTNGVYKTGVTENVFVGCFCTPNITFLPSFNDIGHDCLQEKRTNTVYNTILCLSNKIP